MVGLVVFTWFDSRVSLGRQGSSPALHHYMVIGKEENESSFIFRKMKALIMTMITGTEHSVAFYILPRAFGVVIIS